MHFIDHADLTAKPAETLAGVYRFLGEEPAFHDFDNLEQVTFEDDVVHGFKDLHVIRRKVEPPPPRWRRVYDDAVFQSDAWRTVDRVAEFWKLYRKP